MPLCKDPSQPPRPPRVGDGSGGDGPFSQHPFYGNAMYTGIQGLSTIDLVKEIRQIQKTGLVNPTATVSLLPSRDLSLMLMYVDDNRRETKTKETKTEDTDHAPSRTGKETQEVGETERNDAIPDLTDPVP